MEFFVDLVTTVPGGTAEEPLRAWRREAVTPLSPHPNDPGRPAR
ncbi:hypothetical protein Q2K19_20995 [Micromonospora soli]|nr:hypothetical protein [Micromonospora sp. NBRC 110009]WKT96675.1 hypothetical protein Q2K19_20995 [Micromonospora sp. NBRC 110009]